MATNPELMMQEARAGDAATLGQLLELYRRYLTCSRACRSASGSRARSMPRTSCRRRFSKPIAISPSSRVRPRAVRRLAAADPGDEPGHAAPPVSWHPGPRRPPGARDRRTPSTSSSRPPRPRPDRGAVSPSQQAARANRPCCWPTHWPSCPTTTARSSSCATSKG